MFTKKSTVLNECCPRRANSQQIGVIFSSSCDFVQPAEVSFDAALAAWTITAFLIFLLWFGAFVTLDLLRKKSQHSDRQDDDVRWSFPFLLATFCLAVSLCTWMAIPGTAVVLSRLPHWTGAEEFLDSLWRLIFRASALAIFFLFPLAYFYQEAQGFGRWQGTFARFFRASLEVVVVGGLVYGVIWIVELLLGIGSTSTWVLPSLDLITSYTQIWPGLLLFLLATPVCF